MQGNVCVHCVDTGIKLYAAWTLSWCKLKTSGEPQTVGDSFTELCNPPKKSGWGPIVCLGSRKRFGSVRVVFSWCTCTLLLPGPWQRNPAAKLCWCSLSSVPHVSDRLELHNNNWAFRTLHPGLSESERQIQEAQSNYLLRTSRLLMRLDTTLCGNNTRGASTRCTMPALYQERSNAHSVGKYKMAALSTDGVRINSRAQSLFPCYKKNTFHTNVNTTKINNICCEYSKGQWGQKTITPMEQ